MASAAPAAAAATATATTVASETTEEKKPLSVLGTRSVSFDNATSEVVLIDQRKLPAEFVMRRSSTVDDVANCIKTMVVRGAPAIGATGAYGMVIAARQKAATTDSLLEALQSAKDKLDAARPTAVNLSWATARLLDLAGRVKASNDATVDSIAKAIFDEANALAEQDVELNRRMAAIGAELVPDGANILHHCNTGALATVDYGTALGVIYECHNQGKGIHVWVDETRPRLQGARLTAWELMRAGVPMHLIADNAAGHLMQRGKVDVVVFGADRVAANGDVANKIGTYKLCVVAQANGIPAYAVVPTSTIDLDVATGDDIVIEERGADEVAAVFGVPTAPKGCPVYNPAFDMTPSRYLTGIITEEGVCYPPYKKSLAAAKQRAEERIAKAATSSTAT